MTDDATQKLQDDREKAKAGLEDFIAHSPDLSTQEGAPCSLNLFTYLYNESLKAQGRSNEFMDMVTVAQLIGWQYALSLKANAQGKHYFIRLRVKPKENSGKFTSPTERLKAYYDKIAGEPDNGTRVNGKKAVSFYDFAQGYNEANPEHRLTFRYIKGKAEEWQVVANWDGQDYITF